MIASMLQDLVFFIGIVAVCIVAYGVSTEALINPNRGDISIDMVRQIDIEEVLTIIEIRSGFHRMQFQIFYLIWRPYINLFGEFGTDEIKERMNLEYCYLNKDPDKFDCDHLAQDMDVSLLNC